MPAVSVVAPLHNEEGNIEPLYRGIKDAMAALGRSYEIIFVNDCSSDQTLKKIGDLQRNDATLHCCDLAQNVGENWALLAGVSKAHGEIIVTIDGDFQNDPVFIPALVKKIESGFRVVSGWRRKRVGSFSTRILPSIVANKLISLLSGVPVHDCGCGLKAYRRNVLAGKFVPKGFMNRFSPVAFGVKAGEFTEIEITDQMRLYGNSHYGLSRVLIVLNDLMVVPFLDLPRERTQSIALLLRNISGLGALGAAVESYVYGDPWAHLGIALGVLCLGSRSVYNNITSFINAQQYPIFNIKAFK